MSIISKNINNRIDTLKNDFTVNKDVVHQGVKGGLNEIGISSLIKDVIPTKYKITKGVVENSVGEQSNETDIIIYDDEILPPYIREELSFTPVEAVKYIIEVKSTINAKELKTTIEKFKNFYAIGGKSPTVLFAYSSDIKGSEILRYKKRDKNFFVHPAIQVICVSDKCYYFKVTEEHFIKDYFSVTEFIKLSKIDEDNNLDLNLAMNDLDKLIRDNNYLSKLNRAEFALLIESYMMFKQSIKNLDGKNLTINGIEYNKLKYTIHKWIGIEIKNNDALLSLLSGISNTLSIESFGNYLLKGKNLDSKLFAICFEDMWGNFSCQDFNTKGLDYSTENIGFNLSSNRAEDGSYINKMSFRINK